MKVIRSENILFVVLFGIALTACHRSTDRTEYNSVIKGTDTLVSFTGSAVCQSCHKQQYNEWQASDHFRAMQHAADSTVLGSFDNVSLTADGVTTRFFKRDGRFIINTQGHDGLNHDYEVLYVFGYYPLQQYLIAFPGGRLQASRVSWNSHDKKWFHQYAGETIHHRDWLHWTGNAQNWNTMCASCHSTNLQKNYHFDTDTYSTKWDEINVACESCHGAGSRHVAFLSSAEYKNGSRLPNSGLSYGKAANPQLQLNTCAPCHARHSDIRSDLPGSSEILDDLIPQIISNEFYYADGQIREEDYEYGSFTQSRMFHNNVQCSNCHNPHSGKLKLPGNSLCMSCHEPKYNTKEHHFHAVNTEGAQCINCHMPARTFMGIDQRRDHSFRIPRPDQSAKFGTPNACFTCHQNKSNQWAANTVVKWYGPKRAYHFSDDLLPGSLLDEKSEQHLAKLLTDTLQPEIARATAAYYLGNIQSQVSLNTLLKSLSDPKPLVRYHAVRALSGFSPTAWAQPTIPLLQDKVRAVRIAAAGLFHQLPKETIPAEARPSFDLANAENKMYLQYQTDFAVGNVMLADYYLTDGDHVNAIKVYLRGLQKDSLMNYARLNLSAAYNSVGKNTDALAALRQAIAIDPQNPRIYYNLALLQYEMKDIPAALKSFEKSISLGSMDAGVFYNYGLLLQQQGNRNAAEQILLKGHQLNPQASNLNYALAYLYATEKQMAKARVYAEILQRIDPDNPDYKGLFQSLGL